MCIIEFIKQVKKIGKMQCNNLQMIHKHKCKACHLNQILFKIFALNQNFLPFINTTLTRKVPNTTIAEVASTVDPDETSHNELSHLDLQCLSSSL